MTQQSYSVSRREAARLLGYSTKTIDRMCARGQLRKARQGGRAVIERASIDSYVARLYDGSTPSVEPADLRAMWLPELTGHRRKRGAAA